MLTQDKIKKLFIALNEELSRAGEMGEIGIIGGSVMCLVFDVRKSTKDVDAIFKPAVLIRKLAKLIAEREGVEKDWLNDAAKGYLEGSFKVQNVLTLPHLRVWAPEAKYMLAMKCLSARWDSQDKEDVVFLIKYLKLKNPKNVFEILEDFYPKKRILPKTQFFVEEIFESKKLLGKKW